MTMGIAVTRYDPTRAEEWNAFVAGSKTGTFLFDRGFMDYHRDRFTDHSLMITVEGALWALLPANAVGEGLVSHGGLTYGGFVTDTRMRADTMVAIVEATCDHARRAGFKTLTYKPVPHFYHHVPAEEDLYALFRAGAREARVDLSSAIRLAERVPMSKSKRQGVQAAAKGGLAVRETEDWPACWAILEAALSDRHATRPTHSLAEITRLATAFPDRIRLFGAYLGDVMVAALVIFDCGPTVHVQYIAASETGRALHGIDLIVDHLLQGVFPAAVWFDFGISTEAGGRVLNAGLARQKEMFGARSVVYRHLEVPL